MTDAAFADIATKGGLFALALAVILKSGWYAITRVIEAMDRLSAASTANTAKVAEKLDLVIAAMSGLSERVARIEGRADFADEHTPVESPRRGATYSQHRKAGT